MKAATLAAPVAAHPPIPVAVETIAVMTIAMVGSSVSSQLVDLDIADIAGAFSVSADQASWIACAATMAEIVSIPVAATLVRASSLRTVVLCAVTIYAACAFASLGLETMGPLIVVRTIQSFCSGVLSVLMFVAVMANLPAGAGRNIGLSIFAFASTAPTALNATVGAFVTERWGWQGLYYFDLAWALALLATGWMFLRSSPRAMRFSEIDWIGYAPLALGLAALILFLKQGDRFFWFDDPTIVRAALVACVALPVSVAWFAWHPHPLIDLTLMRTPTFGWAVSIATFYRFGMVMTAFVVPQALMRLQGYRMPEIADANIAMFWAECVSFPVAWLWATRGDARQPLSLGLALFAAGAFVATGITPAWQADDFHLALVLIGLGQGFFLVPTLFYATRDVLPQQGATAAALFNLSRIAGQALGTGTIGALITEREKYHSAILINGINDANDAVAARLASLTAMFRGMTGDESLAAAQALTSLSGTLSTQAFVLAFADAFLIVTAVLGVSALLVLMLPPLRKDRQ